MKNDALYIANELNKLYPNAKCELKHRSNFQLLIAVVLSAQTTDERVNSVTKILFSKYKDSFALANAELKDIENIIKPIGLYHNKAINIVNLSKKLVSDYNGKVPNNRDSLESLPGVGRKTANIILNNCFNEQTFAVDTHVYRVSRRLGITSINDDIKSTEEKLMRYFPSDTWGKLHHQFIFFGRYKCKAINPDCNNCPFIKTCKK